MMKVEPKGGNTLPKFRRGGGAYSEPLGIRALTIIDFWSRGPKATFIFNVLSPCAHFKNAEKEEGA